MEGKFPSSTPKDKNCTLVPTDENNNWKTVGETVQRNKLNAKIRIRPTDDRNSDNSG